MGRFNQEIECQVIGNAPWLPGISPLTEDSIKLCRLFYTKKDKELAICIKIRWQIGQTGRLSEC